MMRYKGTMKLVSEEICRSFFESLFNETFPKVRPNWLRTPRGRCAELDGYSEKLQLAFEYHGAQHYKEAHRFHKGSTLLQRQRDDEFKERQCAERGIQLIVVPYTVSYAEMESFIRVEANRRKLVIASQRKSVDWQKINLTYDRPDHSRRTSAHGYLMPSGRLLSGTMIGMMLLVGCRGGGGRIHLGSPTIQRAPELTCIVILTSDTVDEAIMRAAVEACKDAAKPKATP